MGSRLELEGERRGSIAGYLTPIPSVPLPLLRGAPRRGQFGILTVEILECLRVQAVSRLCPSASPAVSAGFWRNN